MRLIHTQTLTAPQKDAVRALTDACRKAEPITLSAPSEDGLDYLLVYENESEDSLLIAFSFLFFVPQEDSAETVFTCEYTAFVHPRFRRQGHFTSMLNAALSLADAFEKEHNCSVDFCFLTDEKSPAASAVLETIGAEYWYSEYKMVRPLRPDDKNYSPAVKIETADAASCGDADGSASCPSPLFTASLNGEIIGTCALLPSADEVYLYAFQIRDAFRSQGHGKDFLRGMLTLLADRFFCGADRQADPQEDNTSSASLALSSHGNTESVPLAPFLHGNTAAGASVSVQVSGLNYIARNLYKKTGFRKTESLSYYIY